MAEIKFVYPKRTLTLSVTGYECALNCPHCRGHYLEHMKWLDRKEEDKKKVTSYLISGGCDLEGAVPLANHLDLLKALSRKAKVIAHTGLIKEEDVALISPYIYAASFNMIGEDSTIKEVYNLNKTTSDFIASYNALKSEVRTYPHITIGLHQGVVRGEYKALDKLSPLGPRAVVFNVFIPTRDTEFQNIAPPDLKDVYDVISYAKKKMNGTELYLGCMRPGGSYREKLDTFCVKMEMDRIVMPTRSARQLAEKMGHEITESQECCII
ncbi:MAG: radical SAM protein [Thermoplasmata archaeon]|nr:MAG: radical SAM protein [Thermoplasmata archaeon]